MSIPGLPKLIFGAPPAEPPEGGHMILQGVGATANSWNGNIRCVLTPSALVAPGGTLTEIRFGFQANAGFPLANILNLSVGHQAGSGDAYDMAATPVQVLFGGNPGTAIPTSFLWSDWASFGWDQSTNLVIHLTIQNNNSGRVQMLGPSNTSPMNLHWKSGASEHNVADVSGYSASGENRLANIRAIEAR